MAGQTEWARFHTNVTPWIFMELCLWCLWSATLYDLVTDCHYHNKLNFKLEMWDQISNYILSTFKEVSLRNLIPLAFTQLYVSPTPKNKPVVDQSGALDTAF